MKTTIKKEGTVEGQVYLNHRAKRKYYRLQCYAAVLPDICRFCDCIAPSHHHAFCMLDGQTNKRSTWHHKVSECWPGTTHRMKRMEFIKSWQHREGSTTRSAEWIIGSRMPIFRLFETEYQSLTRHSMLRVPVVYRLEADPAWISLYTRQLTSNRDFERKLNKDLFGKDRGRGSVRSIEANDQQMTE